MTDQPTTPAPVPAVPFQSRVQPWMMACFGSEISADRLERGDRLLEEVLELLQSGSYPRERIASLSSYVWSRPKGEPAQEVGGVMVTLAAYCLAHDLDMHEAGETELARVWTKVEKIRAKQAAKPVGSALPQAWPVPAVPDDVAERDIWQMRAEEAEEVASSLRAAIEAQAAELARLKDALACYRDATNHSRLAFAGYVSPQSAIDKLDALAQPADLQLSAREVEGDAPDQTGVSPGPSAAPTDNTALVEAIRWAHDTLWELNPSNYNHDDVCRLNDASVEVILGLAPLLGERHGKSPEWWAARAALASREAKPAPDAVAEAGDPASIIAAVCEEMNGNGFTSKPRIVSRAGFDLSKFKEQRSDYAGVETEWVDQRGPGMCGDDFYGTLAVPIDAERLFVVEYNT